jgi:tripartite-type tricarboxylate transporter receptor subunit TctC
MAVVMPAGSPSPAVARLNRAVRDAISAEDVARALKSQGLEPAFSTPDALRDRIQTELSKWRDLAAPANVNALQ